MRIFKVKKDGIIYKVYEAVKDFNETIIKWKYVGEAQSSYWAYEYIRLNGREYNPLVDKVKVVWWDGQGTYMR